MMIDGQTDGQTGRMYQISDSDYEKILNLELEIGTHCLIIILLLSV